MKKILSLFFCLVILLSSFVSLGGCSSDASLYKRSGEFIYFGEYPQSLKEDDVAITGNTNSKGYYMGSDGKWYAKVVANARWDDCVFFDGTKIIDGHTYYFKVEPIRWRILSEKGGEALLFCDSILTYMPVDEGDDNNYEESTIRAWLNNWFYSVAFDEKDIVLETEVNNSPETTGHYPNRYACANTFDKVFLLSYLEAVTSEYGFSSDEDEEDPARQLKPSDYARALGVYANEETGSSLWCLRSPSDSNSYATRYVRPNGYIALGNNPEYEYGIVPAIRIRLK